MSKGFWGVIVAVILVFVGVVALNGGGDKSNSSSTGSNSSLSQHVIGKGTSGVTLVEYGDYECPFCEQYYSTVKAVQQEYGDKIKFQFRNYPLTQLHRNAFAAARAAEAASLQNKFWEMHDALYDSANYQQWSTASNPNPYFEAYAGQLGLNVNQYKTDFASSKVNDIVNADMAEGNKLGITGTPTFFLNGKKAEIANDQQAFEKAINQAIANASKPQ
jgi:protein-disulfide isomerase